MTKRRKNYYFTKVHEQAIINYCLSDDQKERNQLYEELIGPAFDEMVDKIVYTYKFTNLPNIDCLKDDCKNWLITILDKYDPHRGSKAFSYFSVITKNWFIHKVKKTMQRSKREVLVEDYSSTVIHSGKIKNSPLVIYNDYIDNRIKEEFWFQFKEMVDHWEKLPVRQNEKKVIQAIQILFEESENIEIFNKKAIYLYIREITGLNTKQVVSSLNKIRIRYREFKIRWDEEE
tara:strand:+ start:31074 stop:31769 length:696 start_codon:yes stop_codon:yes gene_type:complete